MEIKKDNRGRKKVEDKVIPVVIYKKQSVVDSFGGIGVYREKLSALADIHLLNTNIYS